MRSKTTLTLVACAMLGAAALGVVQAQTNPTSPAGERRGGTRRGGFGGFGGLGMRGGPPAPWIEEGYDDHQNMMDQLGIKTLRPGKSGSNQSGPGFDEATANEWMPTLPDALTTKDGTKVTTSAQWTRRRAEILEDFEREVYGRIPASVPKVTWEVTETTEGEVDGVPTISKTLVGHVDNSAFPDITVDIQASFTVPANAPAPVPLFLQFGFGGFGGRMGGGVARQALSHGWGYGSINPNSIQADRGGNALRQGIIGLTNKGKPRKPDDWGALRAWGWGVGRLIDYFEANPDTKVDPKKVGIEGVSRYGKAALVTQAFDPRVAVALVASSGEGGAKLHRHDYGEAVENLTGSGEYHWMCGNFLKYGASDINGRSMNASDLPVDSHELIALCAPRPCFISYGVEPGDPKWVDAPGSYRAGILASKVYEVLGLKGYGSDIADWVHAPLPPVGTLVGGELAFRQHEGGHTSGPNIPHFFEWVGNYIKSPVGAMGLKDAYAGKFLVGAAGDIPRRYSDAELANIKANYNVITPENCMKPQPTHPAEDTYNFTTPDALVQWCQDNNVKVWGHTLAWHAQTAPWFFQAEASEADATEEPAAPATPPAEATNRRGGRRGFGGFGRGMTGPLASREVALERLKDHIMTLVGRYQGRITGWDVFNESIADGGDGSTENLRTNSWYRVVGPDVLTMAFKWAHEADPDAQLYYNDYNIEQGAVENKGKHASSMLLLRRLIAEGAPIHGVGIQGHWHLDTNLADVEKAITNYASLGLRVAITELDVTATGRNSGAFGVRGGNRNIPPENYEKQAEVYRKLFEIFLRHSDAIDRVTFWGISDRRSWRRGQDALLFDGELQPKPAYQAILDVASGRNATQP